MLNLAGFNSTIYSFNNKTWVSLTPIHGSAHLHLLGQTLKKHIRWVGLGGPRSTAKAREGISRDGRVRLS